jgi:hypothetical protein
MPETGTHEAILMWPRKMESGNGALCWTGRVVETDIDLCGEPADAEDSSAARLTCHDGAGTGDMRLAEADDIARSELLSILRNIH